MQSNVNVDKSPTELFRQRSVTAHDVPSTVDGRDTPNGSLMREYVGVIWIEDKPGLRLHILAGSLEEARSRVIEEYGEGHVISIWNEEDASSAR